MRGSLIRSRMKSLIGLIKKIQRACTVLGDHGGEGMSLWKRYLWSRELCYRRENCGKDSYGQDTSGQENYVNIIIKKLYN